VQEVQAERPTQMMKSGLGMLGESLEDTMVKIDTEIYTKQ